MEMKWREARQKTQLEAFICLMPQISACTGETCTSDRKIPFPSSTALGGQEESVEQWDWHLGVRRRPWNNRIGI